MPSWQHLGMDDQYHYCPHLYPARIGAFVGWFTFSTEAESFSRRGLVFSR